MLGHLSLDWRSGPTNQHCHQKANKTTFSSIRQKSRWVSNKTCQRISGRSVRYYTNPCGAFWDVNRKYNITMSSVTQFIFFKTHCTCHFLLIVSKRNIPETWFLLIPSEGSNKCWLSEPQLLRVTNADKRVRSGIKLWCKISADNLITSPYRSNKLWCHPQLTFGSGLMWFWCSQDIWST